MSDEPRPPAPNDHRHAQELSGEAAAALGRGEYAEALRLYREAAVYERRAFVAVPPAKVRTWCLLAVSAASLLYKGREFAEAERFLYLALSRPDLPPWAFLELRELLDAVRDMQALPAGTRYGDRVLSFTLRGGEVGSGTAPIDLMVEKGDAIRHYLTRGVEWAGRDPLRRRGVPKDDVRRLVEARVTQPTAGSFRFSVKLVEPVQVPLFDDPVRPPVSAAVVGDTLFDLARHAVSPVDDGGAALRAVVPDEEYRATLLGLLRNIVPSNASLSEVEIGYARPGSEEAPTPAERLLLPAGTRRAINRAIVQARPRVEEPFSAPPMVTIRGQLRALDLDREWLSVTTVSGPVELRAEKPVDDLIGPFVNRTIVARVMPRPATRGGRPSYTLIDPIRDLDLDTGDGGAGG